MLMKRGWMSDLLADLNASGLHSIEQVVQGRLLGFACKQVKLVQDKDDNMVTTPKLLQYLPQEVQIL